MAKPGILASVRRAVTVASDTFNRADSTSGLGTSDSGHTWSSLAGTWGIDTNEAYIVSNAASGLYATVLDAGVADCTVEVTLVATTGASVGNYGLSFRATDINNWWRFNADDNNDNLYLSRMVAGSHTSVQTVNAAGIAPGDVLKVVLSGNDIDCYHNGTLKASTTDSAFNTVTKHGLMVSLGSGTPSTAARWDDFSVVA